MVEINIKDMEEIKDMGTIITMVEIRMVGEGQIIMETIKTIMAGEMREIIKVNRIFPSLDMVEALQIRAMVLGQDHMEVVTIIMAGDCLKT